MEKPRILLKTVPVTERFNVSKSRESSHVPELRKCAIVVL